MRGALRSAESKVGKVHSAHDVPLRFWQNLPSLKPGKNQRHLSFFIAYFRDIFRKQAHQSWTRCSAWTWSQWRELSIWPLRASTTLPSTGQNPKQRSSFCPALFLTFSIDRHCRENTEARQEVQQARTPTKNWQFTDLCFGLQRRRILAQTLGRYYFRNGKGRFAKIDLKRMRFVSVRVSIAIWTSCCLGLSYSKHR